MTTRVRTLAAFALTAFVVAGTAGAARDPIGAFPAGWTHAEINVVQNGTPHTLIYDRGVVQQVSPSAVVLRERDGSIVTVPVAPETAVRVNGRPGTIGEVKKRMQAQTLRVDGGVATQLRANRRGGGA